MGKRAKLCLALLLVWLCAPLGRPAAWGAAAFSQLDFVPNIETAGVIVRGENLPETAALAYRRSGEAEWRVGHPLLLVKGGLLVGSLFDLLPSTAYEVKVSDGANEIGASFVTQPDQLAFTPSVTIHVDDDAAPGGDGSARAPFQTIQEALAHASPGAEALVSDGVYREAVTFPASGAPGQWIRVRAEGNAAILDGSAPLEASEWKRLNGENKVWYVKWGSPLGYLARDGERFYNFDSLPDLKKGLGHGKVKMNEGWFYEEASGRIYVRVAGNPADHAWQAPRLNHAFDVEAREWIWIEGFEMRFYGTNLEGCGVCARNASHLVIRNNRIHNLQLGVFVNWNGGDAQGNDTRIEGNLISDPRVDAWPWDAVKGSSMEGTGIVLRGHIGGIVRGNEIHNFFNGIYTGSSAGAVIEDPNMTFDADIYENYLHDISDDALEPEGACVNHRFRANRIESALVGVSIAPVTIGPTWVTRNLVANFTGTSIKWSEKSDGRVLFYHNTFVTEANVNAMSMIQPAHNSIMRNNIFQGRRYAFEEPFTGSSGHNWDFDNWYSTEGATRFKWENIVYESIAQLCAATGFECNGHDSPPALGADFRLLASSPNLDRAAPIPGINDRFSGRAPDIGAFEFARRHRDKSRVRGWTPTQP